MTTTTLPKRFTLQVGDNLVDLPEADTRNEALRKAGLTPVHWQGTPARQRQQGKGKAKGQSKPHSTTPTAKKPVLNIITGRRSGMSMNSTLRAVTLTDNCNANYCLFCGKPVIALRKTKHYCNGNCRVADFRKRRLNEK